MKRKRSKPKTKATRNRLVRQIVDAHLAPVRGGEDSATSGPCSMCRSCRSCYSSPCRAGEAGSSD